MKNYTLLFAAIFAVLLTSCQKEELKEFSPTNDTTIQSYDTPDKILEKTSPKKNIAQYLQEAEDFSLFYQALEHAKMSNVLMTKDITVFAPNNLVMKTFLGKGKYGNVQDVEPELLKTIMMAHISVTGVHTIDSSKRGQDIEVLYQPKSIYMKTTDGSLQFGNLISYINIADQHHINGVIHQIDGVLIP